MRHRCLVQALARWHCIAQLAAEHCCAQLVDQSMHMQVILLLTLSNSHRCMLGRTADSMCPAGCSANPDKPLPALAQVRLGSLPQWRDTQHQDTAWYVVLHAPLLGRLCSGAACRAITRHCSGLSALHNTTQTILHGLPSAGASAAGQEQKKNIWHAAQVFLAATTWLCTCS